MRSNVDNSILDYLRQSNGKAEQKTLIQSMRAYYSDSHVYRRIKHLEARGKIEVSRDGSDIVLTLSPEVSS